MTKSPELSRLDNLGVSKEHSPHGNTDSQDNSQADTLEK